MTNRQLRKIGIGLIPFKIRIKRYEPHIPIGVEQKVIVEILQPDNSTLVFKFSDGSEEVKQHRTRDKYIQEIRRLRNILNKVDLS